MNRLFSLSLVVFILLSAFYLDVHDLPDYPTGLSYDESVEVVDAGLVLQSHQVDMFFYSDGGRPESLYRFYLVLFAAFMGQSLFAFRLATVMLGILGIAAAGAAARAFFLRYPPSVGRLAVLAAMTSLAANQSFMTLSRSMYRAVPTVGLCLLFLALAWRGLHWVLHKHEPPFSQRALLIFAAAGVCIGLAMHTYTSAYFAAFLVPVLFIHLLLFRFWRWRAWLPGMILIGGLLALFLTPPIYLNFTNRERVFARSDVVANSENQQDLKELLRLEDFTYLQTYRETAAIRYLHKGDLNPQYNTARAPFMPRGSNVFFYIGLGICVLFFFRYEAAQVLALLAVSLIPVTLANELFHGLRGILGLAVVPLLCGTVAGQFAALVEAEMRWLKPLHYVTGLAALGVMVYIPAEIGRIMPSYRSYFVDINPEANPRRAGELTMGEWYFRPHFRESAAYILAARQAVYLPLYDAGNPQMRSYLQQHYPHVRTWADLPLDEDGYPILPDGLVYAVFHLDKTITDDYRIMVYIPTEGDSLYLLPPLTDFAEAVLYNKAQRGTPIQGDLKGHPIIGHAFPTGAIRELFQFAPISPASGVIFGDHLRVIGYTAPHPILPGEIEVYCLIWSIKGDLARNKLAAIQLWSYDSVGLAGQENEMLRWIYPTSLWKEGDRVPICQRLQMPADSPPGVYWLAVGTYEHLLSQLEAKDPHGNRLGRQSVAIAPLKIPQQDSVGEPDYPLDAQLYTPEGQIIRLLGYDISAQTLEAGQTFHLNLYWQSTDSTAQPYTIFVHVYSGNNLVAQQDVQPWEERYPTLIWEADEVVRTAHQLTIPAKAQPPLTLYVGMYSPADFQRLPVQQAGQMDDNNGVHIPVDSQNP